MIRDIHKDMADLAKRAAEGELLPEAILVEADGGVTMLATPDMDDQMQRTVIKRMTAEKEYVFVATSFEAWTARVDASNEVGVARLKKAQQEKTLHLYEGREEVLIYYAESKDEPIQRWNASITYEKNGKRKIGPWELTPLKMPRPTFKRYFPEGRT